jgi:hypothetical protein
LQGCSDALNGLSIYCNSSGSQLVHPKPCRAGIYCLEQVSSNETDGPVLAGITRPKLCTEGYFCEENSNTPQGKDGKGICPKGHYCERGSAIPRPAEEGKYVGTEGRSFSELCPSGKYADVQGLEECLECPVGHFCYDSVQDSGVVTPKPCPAGKYKDKLNTASLLCLSCTAGRFGAREGLDDAKKCNITRAGMICNSFGLTFAPRFVRNLLGEPVGVKDQLCEVCREGYFCPEGTFALQESMLCPEGFFCTKGTETELLYSDSRACPAGYFCQRGTLDSSKTQNVCPKNHFCPFGSSEAMACPPGTKTFSTAAKVIGDCYRDNEWLTDNGRRVISINPSSDGKHVGGGSTVRLDPFAYVNGEWVNPPVMKKNDTTFSLHICGYTRVDFVFNFFKNKRLQYLLETNKIKYDEHFRIAVYAGKGATFPPFKEEMCDTASINDPATQKSGSGDTRTETVFDSDYAKKRWDKLVKSQKENFIYIDKTDRDSCGWCLTGEAMPRKCIVEKDSMLPNQKSFIEYFSHYNDMTSDICDANIQEELKQDYV